MILKLKLSFCDILAEVEGFVNFSMKVGGVLGEFQTVPLEFW